MDVFDLGLSLMLMSMAAGAMTLSRWALLAAKVRLERSSVGRRWRPSRRRRARLRRHRIAASSTTAAGGAVALVAVCGPLQAGVIPFVPGTDVVLSALRAASIAAGFGVGGGVYLAARAFFEHAAWLEEGQRRPSRGSHSTSPISPPALFPVDSRR